MADETARVVTLLGAATAWPVAARAQDRIQRVGILMNFAADDAVARARASKFVEA
jgi:hypothetical protein